MKNLKLILISLLLITTMLFSIVGCKDKTDGDETPEPSESVSDRGDASDSSSDSESDEGKESKETSDPRYTSRAYKFAEIADQIKLVGRTQVLSNGISCDFTASGVEFKAYVKGNLKFTVNCDKETYFTVFVDGERMGGTEKRFQAKAGVDTIINVGNLGSTVELHEIRILKQTEPQYSTCVLKKLNFYGALEGAMPEKDMYIEFLGDSITCGYGNLIADNVDDDNAWKAVNSDGTSAYAFLTAEALGADASIISCSGIGIDKGWTSFNEMTFYTKASYFRNNTELYDFSSARVPDIVVINLGTNDNSRGSTEAQFKENVKELIEFIRSSYGKDMPIVWAHNMMGECKFAWVQDVFTEMGDEDAKLYSVELNENRSGGNGHPTLSAHKTAAQTLANYISQIPLNNSTERLHYNRTYSLDANLSQLKQVGRTQVTDNGIICDYTASGIEFKAYVKGNLKFTVNCNKDTYFTVMVDGVRKGTDYRFKATGGTADVTIDVGSLGDTAALHEIRILKQTEPQNSLCVMKNVQFCGVLDSAMPEKDLYIEFLGDSITCGYGNLTQGGGNETGSALYQDGTRTYAFLAAEALNADASVISCSGIGIDKGWTSFNEMTFYTKASYFRNNTSAYNFSAARVPDVVVINLGTNDNSRGSTEAQFKQNVKDLISFIRTSYGKDIPIVWAYNMMGACCFDWTSAVLTELGGTDAGLYSVQLTQNNAGGNGHPTLQAQIDNSTILANFIKNNVLK